MFLEVPTHLDSDVSLNPGFLMFAGCVFGLPVLVKVREIRLAN